MKMKSLVLLAVAVGCGLVALLGVQQVLSGDRGDQVERVKVLVARTEIEPGVPLDKDNCDFREIPKDAIPTNPVTLAEQFENRALTSRAYANQVICVPQLGEKGVFGAAINIPEGMRVVTIPVNATTTHSGMLKAGDRVDALATFTVSRPGIGQVQRTKTILEYIEVFATDSTRIGLEEPGKGANKDGVKNVSLLVTPKQANVMNLAQSKGTVHLALRNKNDMTRSETGDIDEGNLESMQSIFDENVASTPKPAEKDEPKNESKPSFGEYLAQEPETAEAPTAAKPTWKVTIYAGGEKKVEELELPEAEVQVAPAVKTSAKGNWMKTVGGLFGAAK